MYNNKYLTVPESFYVNIIENQVPLVPVLSKLVTSIETPTPILLNHVTAWIRSRVAILQAARSHENHENNGKANNNDGDENKNRCLEKEKFCFYQMPSFENGDELEHRQDVVQMKNFCSRRSQVPYIVSVLCENINQLGVRR